MRRIPGDIDHSDDRAGDTGREPRVEETRVSFCAGAKTEITNSSRPSFPQGILAGSEGLPTSEVRGLRPDSFLRQDLLHRARRRADGYLLLLL